MEGSPNKSTPIFAKNQFQFKRGMHPTVAKRRRNCILQRSFIYKFFASGLIRIVNIAPVINSFPEPLVVEAKEEF